jgi:HPt (histidine-containing phosphotransfer) domain-containing protein
MTLIPEQNNSSNNQNSDAIKKIQLEYEKTIPKKLQELKTLQDAAKKTPSLDNLTALRFFVHKLAGSAGTYGFLEVSTLCKQYEQDILEVLKNPTALKWMTHFDNYYDQVKKEFIHA